MLLVRQNFPDRRLADIPGEIFRELSSANFGARLAPGSTVAIGVGSRGIGNIDVIVRAVVDFWKSRGFVPFIFPAMGSHGAATAEGQTDVLAHYGVSAEAIDCEVRSSLDVVSLGKSSAGIEVFLDQHASQASGVFLVGRVKQHTDFAGKIESGLYKMMAIGLGKWAGAKNYHMHARQIGLEAVIRSVGRQVLGSGKILGGLAILEDAFHNTAKLAAVPADVMEQREEELLALSKTWAATLPCDLDLLIVDEIGKNYSGAGMDTKIVNRGVEGEINPWPGLPHVERIFARALSEHSYGNASGVGMAEVVTDRLAAAIDNHATWLNVLTATTPRCGKLPIHFPTDLECVERIVPTLGKHNQADVRIGWIENTLAVSPIALSENMRPEIENNPRLTIVAEAHELPFGADGNLPVRALRSSNGAH
jgi:hypothetical protein